MWSGVSGVVSLLSIPVLLIIVRRHHGGVNVCIRTAPSPEVQQAMRPSSLFQSHYWFRRLATRAQFYRWFPCKARVYIIGPHML